MDTLGSYGRERALCETEEQLLPTRNVNRRAEIPNGQQRGDTQQPTCRKQFFDGRARIPAYQVSVPPTSVPTCMVECRANYSSEKRYIKNAKEPHFLLRSRKPQGKHFSQNHQYTRKPSHNQKKRCVSISASSCSHFTAPAPSLSPFPSQRPTTMLVSLHSSK